MENKYSQAERIFKAFADENRIKILEMLIDGEKYADSILKELDISQPTLSHHMKILCESGVVNERKDGRRMYYSISEAGRDMAFDMLAECTMSDREKKAFLTKKKSKRNTDNIVIL